MASVYDVSAIDELAHRRGVDPQHLRALRNSFFKKRFDWAEAREAATPALRDRLLDDIDHHPLVLAQREDSDLDGASKLLLETSAGFRIETVILRIASGRTSLCVSSQVGCAAACTFCATGRMQIVRDLSPAEILDQVRLSNRILQSENRRVRNVVFMGMGEPFHNEDAVYQSLDVLLDPRCFEFSPGRVTVSTVGVPDAMVRCARRYPSLHLALSLHSARQEVRETIMPLARRYSLQDLRAALDEVAAIQGQRILIEYLLLDGLTDTPDDVDALVTFLDGLDVHLNLIRYNKIDEADELSATPTPRQVEFSDALKARGMQVTSRYSLGSDIAAACGQLVRRENRDVARRERR